MTGAPRRRGPGRPAGHTAEATRSALLDATERLVVEAGYDAATTRQVAASAGTQVAGLRHHFGSKAGAFSAAFERAMGRVVEVLGDELSDGRATTVGDALRRWSGFVDRYPDTAAFLAVAPLERARHVELQVPVGEASVGLEAVLRAEVRGWAAAARPGDGPPEDAVDADVLADALIAIVFGALVYPARIDPNADATAVLDAVARVLDRAELSRLVRGGTAGTRRPARRRSAAGRPG